MSFSIRFHFVSAVFLSLLLFVGVQGGDTEQGWVKFSEALELSQAEDIQEGTLKKAEKKKIGMILSLKGKAFAIGADGKKRLLRKMSALYVGDRVETKKKSLLQMSFIDGSTYRMVANTDYTIEDYQFNEEKGVAVSDGSVDDGTLSFLAGKIAKIAPQNYKIETATATIGIRGSAGEIAAVSGSNPSTIARTVEGHVLEVETDFGNFVLDDPKVGIEVTLTGVKMVTIDGSLLDQAEEEEAEEEEETEEEEEEEEEAEEEEEEAEEEEAEEEETEEESEAEETEESDETEGEEAAAAEEEAGGEADPMAPPPDPELKEVPQVEIGVDLQSIRSALNEDVSSNQTVPDDYTGYLVGFKNANFPSFSSEVGVRNIEADEKMIVTPKKSIPFSSRVLDLQEPEGEEFKSVLQRQSLDLDTGIKFNILQDNTGEFFIVNEDSIGLTTEGNTFSSIYYGVKNRGDLPRSGLVFYGTDISRLPGESEEERIIIGSLLTRSDTILDLGTHSFGMVDYSKEKVFGMVEEREKSLAVYYGELNKVNASIRNLHVYGNIEYNDIDSNKINEDLLMDLSGEGHIYGESAQGLGVYAKSMDSTGHFISSGFKYSSNPTKISSSNGDYPGFAQGMRVVNADQSKYTLTGASSPFTGIDPFSLSVDFSENSLNGSLFLGGHAINIGGGSANFSYDRNNVFAEMSSFTLPLEAHSSFIHSWTLPDITVDPNAGETRTPSDVMWGSWNMVEKIESSIPDIYPGMNNFWVAGKRKYGKLAGPLSYYQSSSLATFAHKEDDSYLPKGSFEGSSSFVLDKENKTFQGLLNFSNSYFVPVKGKITDMNLGKFVADEWSVLSFYGDNKGLFSSSLSNEGTFQGRLAGSGGGPNLLYEFQRSYLLQDISYGVGLGVQTHVASDVGLKDFRGFSSGLLLESQEMIGNAGMILNFQSPLLHSDMTWYALNSSAEEPYVIPSYQSRSVLRMDSLASSNNEAVSYATYGDFGLLKDLSALDYAYYTESPIAPRISLFIDTQTANVDDIQTNNNLITKPVMLASGEQTGEWVSSSLDEDVGDLWLIDMSDSNDVRIYIEGAGGEKESYAFLSFNTSKTVFSQTLNAWFEDPDIGELLKEAKVKGLEISFNAYDLEEDSEDLTAYIDRVGLSNSNGFTLAEEWDVDTPIKEPIYISKDTFFIPEANRYLPIDEIGGGYSADKTTSFVVSLPGLESFDYLSWGVWGSLVGSPDGSIDRAFGFYALGDYSARTTVFDRMDWMDDNPSIANSVITYRGEALGAVFGYGRTGEIQNGSALLNVNFNTGDINGLISLPQDRIEMGAGKIDYLESYARDSLIYHGSTIMNGASFFGGAYRGQFFGKTGEDFAKESAGTFSGSDGLRKAVGAFGVKK